MNNSSPFGQSLQGSRSFQNNTQSAPQQMFGGFQPQQSFGGFGGGQGFGGFNPFQGGYGGGFQPQQQFNPFQGGYGGGFQPQGFGGGFNPMFGGIGGLGFNPMMGPQFSMPMQKFAPYQQQMFQPRGLNFDDSPMGVRPDFTFPAGFVEEAAQQNFPSMDMMYRGGPQMSPEMRQRREQDMRNMERMAQQPSNDPNRPPSGNLAPPQSPYSPPTSSDGKWVFSSGQWYPNSTVSKLPAPESPGLGRLAYDPAYERPAGYGTTQPAVPQRAQQTIADYRRQQPMYGGIGGLGFNPMMGRQFMQQHFMQQQFDQQDLQRMQQQPTVNLGGKSMQDWQAQYNQMYNPNRMTMDMPPSLEEFIQRRTNPISFPGMPGFTL